MKEIHSRIILAVTSALITSILFTGCNKTIFDTQYTFNKAIVTINGKQIVIDIVEWTDYQGEQIQIKASDGNIYLFSSYNCVLVDCRKENELNKFLK